MRCACGVCVQGDRRVAASCPPVSLAPSFLFCRRCGVLLWLKFVVGGSRARPRPPPTLYHRASRPCVWVLPPLPRVYSYLTPCPLLRVCHPHTRPSPPLFLLPRSAHTKTSSCPLLSGTAPVRSLLFACIFPCVFLCTCCDGGVGDCVYVSALCAGKVVLFTLRLPPPPFCCAPHPHSPLTTGASFFGSRVRAAAAAALLGNAPPTCTLL